MPPDEFRKLVGRSRSIKDALAFFGLKGEGNSYHTFVKRATEDGIDLSVMPSMKPGGLLNEVRRRGVPLNEVMVVNSTFDTTNLKKRLLKDGVLENKCAICSIWPEWNNKPLSFRLDHINGVNSDNRLRNLRLVCPNCDSQLDTYCGRNRVKNRRTIKNCKDCGKRLSKHNGERCRSCNSRQQPKITKIAWPNDEELVAIVLATNKLQVSRNLGVSEAAVRKRLRRIGVLKTRPYKRQVA